MIVPTAVRHWVTQAEAAHGAGFERAFPSGFDWRRFVADAPAFAERLGETFPAATGAAAKARLEDLAAAAFRGGWIGGLALLAAYDAERDPEDALARLVEPMTESEEDDFAERVERDLASIDEILGGEEPREAAGEEAVEAARLARSLRPTIRELLREGLRSGARAVASLGAGGDASARVLGGVVNVALALAALRYQAAVAADESAGLPPLRHEGALLSGALGPPD
jgi:hypothetical protein